MQQNAPANFGDEILGHASHSPRPLLSDLVAAQPTSMPNIAKRWNDGIAGSCRRSKGPFCSRSHTEFRRIASRCPEQLVAAQRTSVPNIAKR
eukprot:2486555-Rhodomonas_salina.2